MIENHQKNNRVIMSIFFRYFQLKIIEKQLQSEIGLNRPKLSKSVFFMIFQPKTSKTYAEISSSNFGTIFGHFGQNGPFWP